MFKISNLPYYSAFFRYGTSTVASVVNFVLPSQVYHSERLSVHQCLQHVGRDAERGAGSSATA